MVEPLFTIGPSGTLTMLVAIVTIIIIVAAAVVMMLEKHETESLLRE